MKKILLAILLTLVAYSLSAEPIYPKMEYREQDALNKAKKEYKLTLSIYNQTYSSFEHTLKKLHQSIQHESLPEEITSKNSDLLKEIDSQKQEIDKKNNTKQTMLKYAETNSKSFSQQDLNNFLTKYTEIESSIAQVNTKYTESLMQLYISIQDQSFLELINKALEDCKVAEQNLKKTEEILKESINKLKIAQKDLIQSLIN